MKKVDIETLKDASLRLMFKMSDKEYETLLDEFDILFKQMKKIGEIKGVDDAIPMTFPFNIKTTYLREDIPNKSLDINVALKNAPSVQEGQIKLPKVVK